MTIGPRSSCGVQGRSWVARDPVGPDDQISDLIRDFLERCDDFGGIPVFYESARPISIGMRTLVSRS
jgi:lysylphosphatidylglycerol synthetase-like protein (DUF2156 family)